MYMHKISLDDCLKGFGVAETSVDTIKKINGGCTFKVGRCLNDGTGWIMSVYSSCSKHGSHADKAKTWAKNNLEKGAHAKVKVTDSKVTITT